MTPTVALIALEDSARTSFLDPTQCYAFGPEKRGKEKSPGFDAAKS
jgi:hypothetical protein